jgi:hypothetical protein
MNPQPHKGTTMNRYYRNIQIIAGIAIALNLTAYFIK